MAHKDAVLINLDDIESVEEGVLEQKKLDSLENSYDSFDAQLNSEFTPIRLDKNTTPYQIINGRHRVFWARKKGYTSVPAILG